VTQWSRSAAGSLPSFYGRRKPRRLSPAAALDVVDRADLSVVLAVAWFVAMGLSRVFLGYHRFTDVLVGWTLGFAWVVVVITCHRLYLTVQRTRIAEAESGAE
jgi:membrane-associated phospholipid phosphatase